MDRARHQFLARPAFALHQDRQVRRSDLRQARDDLEKLRILGHDGRMRLVTLQANPQGLILGAQPVTLLRLRDRDFELRDWRGLHQIVRGAELHDLNRARYVPAARENNGLGEGAVVDQTAQYIRAGAIRQVHVEERHVELPAAE